MRCQAARRTLIDAELGPVAQEQRDALDRHLARCAECRAHARRESLLTASLTALRRPTASEIDVRARVAARIAAAPRVPREELGTTEFGWAAAAAVAASWGLLLGLAHIAPGLAGFGGELRAVLGAGSRVLSSLTAPANTLLLTLIRLGTDALSGLGALAGPLRELEPLAIGTVALCSVTMAVSIVLVVGRDLRRAGWIEEETR